MPNDDDFRNRQRANMMVILVVIALVIGTVVLLLALRHGIQQEDCFAAGHHGCARIEETN